MDHLDNNEENANKYFDNLLQNGVKKPVDEVMKDINDMDLPPWFDAVKFKRAQQFYHKNIYAMFIGKLLGLLAVFAIPTILAILASTKKSSTSLTAYKRYISTLFHIQTWYGYDLTPGSKSWRSLQAIRIGHLTASKVSVSKNIGMITQKDMALTQFALFGYIAYKPQQLGIQGTPADFEAFIHFWRVIGFILGIKDEFNVCAASWHETEPRCRLILEKAYKPALNESNNLDNFYDMSDVMINGLWCYNPLIATDPFLFLIKRLSDCDGYFYFDMERTMDDTSVPEYTKLRTNWDKFLLGLMANVHQNYLQFSAVRIFFNSLIHCCNFFVKWFPTLAICRFGLVQAYITPLFADSFVMRLLPSN